MTRVDTGYAEVNGTRLYYEIAGAGDAIVFIHGFSCDTRMWDEQFDELSKTNCVLRYDMRGFGRSDVPDDQPYDPCEDLSALLDFLHIDRCTVVGLSLGGWVAIDFVLAYPERIAGLVAADAAIMGFDWPHGRPSALPVEMVQKRGLKAGKLYWMQSELFAAAKEQPAVLEKLSTMVQDYSGWHWTHENPQIMADVPAIAALDQIKCPTLVIVGERDTQDFHAISNILAKGIEGAQKIEIKGVGHMSNMEAPAEFNQALAEFIN